MSKKKSIKLRDHFPSPSENLINENIALRAALNIAQSESVDLMAKLKLMLKDVKKRKRKKYE